jgi:hypothetical protein
MEWSIAVMIYDAGDGLVPAVTTVRTWGYYYYRAGIDLDEAARRGARRAFAK